MKTKRTGAQPAPRGRVKGVIDVTRSGKGFLLDPKGDIPILRDGLGGALAGDIVEVSLFKGQRETIGRVIRVLERKTNSFVGELIKSPLGTVLHPDNSRVYFDFIVVGSPGAPVGHKAIVDVVDWEGQPPKVKVRSVIGPAGAHETEMRAIVAARGFESDFPPDVLAEAEKLYAAAGAVPTSDVGTARRDFRETLTFTIDPPDAKDFDDAISYKPLERGTFELGIHIADVTSFVRPGTALDREAFKRATSVYLVDRTIPMLPPQLSEDLCSLKPDVDRLTFSTVFTVKNNAITNQWFGRTIIRSQKRFTYDEADVLLLSSSSVQSPEIAQPDLKEAMDELWKFASALRQERYESGAVMFGADEVKPIVDKEGNVTGFKRNKYTESHQLIEELMLLANREVATLVSKKLGKKNRLFVYRIHDVPNQEKIDELAVFLSAIGYQLATGKKTTGKELNVMLNAIKGKPEERLIQTATVRSMAKAVYTTKNIGHYGLAFDDYAHFTSPIRRYPDVMVHRTLASLLAGNQIPEKPEEIEQKAVHASEREVAAAEAERASVKLKQVEYFAKLIGQERDGVISGVTEWGIYIEDTETGAEGMARLTSLTDDTYEYHPKKYAVIGVRTKRAIRMGDPVRYRVESANLLERQMDFSVVEKMSA